MRRVVTAVVGTVLGLVLLLGFKSHQSTAGTPYAAISRSTGSTDSGTSASGSSGSSGSPSSSGGSSGSSGSSGTSSSAGSTAAKTAVGTAVETRYGPVQVRVTMRSGKITSIQALQLPQEDSRDIEIDNYAVPRLSQEVLSAQSTHVDMVSGATYTSEGYLQSVQSALDKLGI